MTDNPYPILVVSRRSDGTRPPAGYRIVRVDRGSALGNPFVMQSEADRNGVCDQYDCWLDAQLSAGSSDVCNALGELVRLYSRGYALALECWCAPKRCHAESVRAAILRAARSAVASR